MSTPIARPTVTEKLWTLLDAAIVAAIPIGKEIRAAKAAVDEAEAAGQKSGQLKLTMCELEIRKYKEAGDAPGLAQAITVLSTPHFESYKDVIKHAQERYKANLAGTEIATPGLAVTVEESVETVKEREVETKTEAKPPAKKAAPRKAAPKKTAAVDPGPSVDDIPLPPDPGPDEDVSIAIPDEPPAKPKTAMSVTEALAKAKERVESEGQRDDSTEEAQDANHKTDLPGTPEGYEPNEPEQNPDDVDAYLAGLDEF